MSKGGFLISVKFFTKLKENPLWHSFFVVSGWPSGLRRCVQVAVSPGGVGSNPTSDRSIEDS